MKKLLGTAWSFLQCDVEQLLVVAFGTPGTGKAA